jgi:hypothetical protein
MEMCRESEELMKKYFLLELRRKSADVSVSGRTGLQIYLSWEMFQGFFFHFIFP